MEKEATSDNSSTDLNNVSSQELFKLLIVAELDELDPKKAKSKRKQLLQLRVDYESDSDS